MRVDKNLLLNIFKERCSIYFYLERFCFHRIASFELSFSPLIFSRKVSAKVKHFFKLPNFREENFKKTFSELVAVSCVSLSKRLQR